MAFCRACGQDVGGAAFCPKCGAAQGGGSASAAAPAGGVPAATASGTEGIAENVAGLLCYLFGWLSGLIFLLIDKRPFVRFHGAQSIAFNIAAIVVSIAFWILVAIFTFLAALMHLPGFLAFLLWPLVGILICATWIYLMVKAFQHEKFKLPIIGDMVEKMVAQ